MNNSTNNLSSDGDQLDSCGSLIKIPIVDDNAATLWLHSSIDRILYTYIIPAVVALGLFGNISVIFVVTRLSRMRTMIVNFYLANLAVTDIVFLSSQSLFLMYAHFVSPVSYNFPFKTQASCNLLHFIAYIAYYCSTSIITLVSIERYFAICRPMYHRRMQSRTHAFKAMCGVWMISFALSVVCLQRRGELFEYCLLWPDDERYRQMPTTFRYCGPVGGNQRITVTMEILFSAVFFVVALLNSFLYLKIILALSSRTIAPIQADESQITSVRNQVARTLVIIGIIFFITHMPIRIFNMNDILDALDEPQFLSKSQASSLLSFSFLFLFLNSALNPYVYAFCSVNYRQGFRDAFSRTST